MSDEELFDPFEKAAEEDEAVAVQKTQDEAEPPPLYFRSLDAFVTVYLSKMYARDLNEASLRWCREWFRHAEAIGRLEALWRAWELLRLDPGDGPSAWWLSHCDPHMRVLLSEQGPFRNCRDGNHAEARITPLPTIDPPVGTFPSY